MLSFLFYVQIVRGSHFRNLARIQHEKKIELLPERGDLYDASGRLIATTNHCYSAYVLPKYIKNKRNAAKLLAKANLGIYEELMTKFADNTFFWLKRKFDADEKKRIEDLNIFGIFLVKIIIYIILKSPKLLLSFRTLMFSFLPSCLIPDPIIPI